MAIAGKVAFTLGGEWSDKVSYDKLVLVTYNMDAYISIKPTAGRIPGYDTDYWMLVLKNVSQEDYDYLNEKINNAIDGTTPVRDAYRLNGMLPEYYATAQSVTNIENGTTAVPKALDADTVGGLPVSDGSGKHGIAFINTDYGVLEIGQIIDFHTGEGQDFKARLAVNNIGELYLTKDMGEAYKLLHSGDSVKVVKDTSAPSDTSSVWVDIANNAIKIYKDGAWTSLA